MRKSDRENLRMLGFGSIGVGVILTLALWTGALSFQGVNLPLFSEVRVGPDGVTVSGLSEQNAMLFGFGMNVFFYLLGGGIVIKARK